MTIRTITHTYLVTLIILLTVSGAVLAQEVEGDDSGEFHCYVGAVGILLVALAIGAGFLCSCRFGRVKGIKPLLPHALVTVTMALYLTGEFILGLTKLNWSLRISLHSILGVIIPTVAWLTVLVSPCIAGKLVNRKTASKIHAVISLILLFLVVLQVIYAYLFLEG
jgi:hypothetical protein